MDRHDTNEPRQPVEKQREMYKTPRLVEVGQIEQVTAGDGLGGTDAAIASIPIG